MDLKDSVREALLELLSPESGKPSPFYRKGEGPGASSLRCLFVGGDREDRSPFYELVGDEKPIQRVLSMGDHENAADDVYTIVGAVKSIEVVDKKIAAKYGTKQALLLTLSTSEGDLRIQMGTVTFTAMKLACLIAKGKGDGLIERGATIGLRLTRGSENAKVIFPSLGIETPGGWKAVSLEGSPFDSDEFKGKTEADREKIVHELMPQIAL